MLTETACTADSVPLSKPAYLTISASFRANWSSLSHFQCYFLASLSQLMITGYMRTSAQHFFAAPVVGLLSFAEVMYGG